MLTSRADKRTWGLPVLCLWLAGCPTPTQYGGPIPINPAGMEERIAWVCGLGQSNPDVSAFCFPDEAASEPQAPASAAGVEATAPITSSPNVHQAPAPGDSSTPAPIGPNVRTPPVAAGPRNEGAAVDATLAGGDGQDSGPL